LKSHGRKTGVFLSVRVRLPEGSSEAFFSASIRNGKPLPGHGDVVPWIGGRTCRPGRTSDVITTSKRTYPDIYARLSDGGKATHSFGHHTCALERILSTSFR